MREGKRPQTLRSDDCARADRPVSVLVCGRGVIGTDPYFWRGEWFRHSYCKLPDRRRAELPASLMGDPAPAPGARFDDERN